MKTLLWLGLGLLLAGCALPAPAVSPKAHAATAQAILTRAAEVRAQATRQPMDGESLSAQANSPVTPEQAKLLARLQPQGMAPELHNQAWLNSEPLHLADLRGKVVLVEFWTYG